MDKSSPMRKSRRKSNPTTKSRLWNVSFAPTFGLDESVVGKCVDEAAKKLLAQRRIWRPGRNGQCPSFHFSG
jgi:hypothetical protein